MKPANTPNALSIVCCLSLLAAGHTSASIEFVGIGRLNGAANSTVNGISADGTFVVGASGNRAIRWTRTDSIADLGTMGFESARANAVDNGGSRVVGAVWDGQRQRAFGFGVRGGTIDTQFESSEAFAVTSDGSLSVGSLNGPTTGSLAFVWESQSLSHLATLPGGTWASAQGVARVQMHSSTYIVIAGTSGTPDGPRAVRWTPGVASLGVLPGGTYSYGRAVAATEAITAIVGQSDSSVGPRAFRWLNGTMLDLGVLPGDTESSAAALNSDGSIVVGHSGTTTTSRAFVWTAETGMIDLRTHLSARGVDLSAWTLLTATGVSGDGMTIVGNGARNNIAEGWVVTLNAIVPCAADFNDSGAISVQDIFDFLASYFAGEFRADFNGTSTLTVQDIFDFLAAYFRGCL